MNKLQAEILNKLQNTIDSDDIQTIASSLESNLSKEQIDKLQKMLKEQLSKTSIYTYKTLSIKQLLAFLE